MPRQVKNICQRKDAHKQRRFLNGKFIGEIPHRNALERAYGETELQSIGASNNILGIQFAEKNTFESLSFEWLQAQKAQLKASSVAKYTNLLNSYLIPSFGSRPIQTIARGEILQFSRDMLTAGGIKGKGLEPKTVNSIISVLKSVFCYATKEKCLSVVDVRDISVRQPQKPMRVLSRSEQAILSEYLYNEPTPCHLGILLCLYTGLRIGEICALKWEDICIKEQYLFIHQSMQRIQTNAENGKRTKIVIQTPKSDCSIRRIPIPDEMLQLLIPHQKQEEAFLLSGTADSFVEPRCMENQFRAVTNVCGIFEVNFHALRHTFATRCVELGFDIKSLSEILGHASVNITLNRYVHPSMELKQENMNRLSALLITK